MYYYDTTSNQSYHPAEYPIVNSTYTESLIPPNVYGSTYNYSNYYNQNYFNVGDQYQYEGEYAFLRPACQNSQPNYNKNWTFLDNSSLHSSYTLDSTGNSLDNSKINASFSPDNYTSTEVSNQNLNSTRCSKSRKQLLPDEAVDIMNDWFQDHIHNPYPTMEEKEKLARLGGITVKQVNAWFSNRRNRSQNTKPKRIKRAIEQEMNEMIHQLSYNSNKTEIIEKFRRTFMSN
ncbi:pre B cell leukemia transcription factor 1 [Brachionus plicatilis]|uniref:Pre B cell leukemia transcription factor 1 n=1 Tax=Brachionus plicatilis TaxID=10195 RepID=A0A3M7SCP0_BRAPC|nr:pre B cell leukemia transcription factor 1 [Brachionus plicatilis]